MTKGEEKKFSSTDEIYATYHVDAAKEMMFDLEEELEECGKIAAEDLLKAFRLGLKSAKEEKSNALAKIVRKR